MKALNILAVFVGLVLSVNVWSAPMTELRYSGSGVTIGDVFELELWADGDGIGESLLSFGFDVDAGANGLLSYDSFSLGADFLDVSDPFNPMNVSGLNAALPVPVVDEMLIATLSFTAIGIGTEVVSASGPYDGLFYGLFYEDPFSGFDIDASFTLDIADVAKVPEPSSFALFVLGFLTLRAYRK